MSSSSLKTYPCVCNNCRQEQYKTWGELHNSFKTECDKCGSTNVDSMLTEISGRKDRKAVKRNARCEEPTPFRKYPCVCLDCKHEQWLTWRELHGTFKPHCEICGYTKIDRIPWDDSNRHEIKACKRNARSRERNRRRYKRAAY